MTERFEEIPPMTWRERFRAFLGGVAHIGGGFERIGEGMSRMGPPDTQEEPDGPSMMIQQVTEPKDTEV